MNPAASIAGPGSAPDPALAPLPSAAARAVFGDRLPLAAAYAGLLASDGVTQGHLGPREVPRLWDRHLVNCALLTDLLPANARVVDVGSGAGLPGLALAIRRADLRVVLLEPMLRRTRFLTDAVRTLGLGAQVEVVRGRAEDPAMLARLGSADWVVARAVAPLDRLVRWCLPLLAPGGRLLALKGATAGAEVEQHRSAVQRLGAGAIEVHQLGADPSSDAGAAPTWVVAVPRVATRRPKGSKR